MQPTRMAVWESSVVEIVALYCQNDGQKYGCNSEAQADDLVKPKDEAKVRNSMSSSNL